MKSSQINKNGQLLKHHVKKMVPTLLPLSLKQSRMQLTALQVMNIHGLEQQVLQQTQFPGIGRIQTPSLKAGPMTIGGITFQQQQMLRTVLD